LSERGRRQRLFTEYEERIMKLPKQANPIQRTNSSAKIEAQISPSGLPCTLTCAACNLLSGLEKTLCVLAASAAGCSC
jgi:hypothetical protein